MKITSKYMLGFITVLSTLGAKAQAQSVNKNTTEREWTEADIVLLEMIQKSNNLFFDDSSRKIVINDIQILEDLKKHLLQLENPENAFESEDVMMELINNLKVNQYYDLQEKGKDHKDMSFSGA